MNLKKTFIIFILIINSYILSAQTVLDNYIKEGLNSNLTLQIKEFDLEQSILAIKEARGMFFPSITLNARYTWAGGGRTMSIPVGDLLNPIYNELNTQHGTTYPTNLGDQPLSITPSREQETSVQVIQPLFIPQIYFNIKVQANIRDVRETDILIYKRYLVSEIKQAYFNYLKAVNVVFVYEKMTEVLIENQRVSETLFASGKATEDVVYRAKTEIANLTQKTVEAEKNVTLAESYFNFLINRPLDSSIEMMDTDTIGYDFNMSIEEAEAYALCFREEFILFSNYLEAQDYAVKLSRSNSFPEISAVFNYGFIGENYRFSADNDFWSASIVLRWQLFNGLSNVAKTQAATIEQEQLNIQLQELKESVRLEVKAAYDNLLVAEMSIITATEGSTAAQKYFEIISYKYEQGMSSQMEYMDAQTSLTNAEINMLISEYDFYIYYARLEHVTGLQNNNNESISILP